LRASSVDLDLDRCGAYSRFLFFYCSRSTLFFFWALGRLTGCVGSWRHCWKKIRARIRLIRSPLYGKDSDDARSCRAWVRAGSISKSHLTVCLLLGSNTVLALFFRLSWCMLSCHCHGLHWVDLPASGLEILSSARYAPRFT
jgi:hypothetical protein